MHRDLLASIIIVLSVSSVHFQDQDQDKPALDYTADCTSSGCHDEYSKREVIHDPVASEDCDSCHEEINKEDHRFELVAEGVNLCYECHEDYAEEFTQTDLDQKRDVIRTIKAFNQEQMHKLSSLLAFMKQRDFEFLVQELLESMGYEDIKITRESGSKGVEVIASFQFGISTVPEVIHVKRYQSSTGRPALDQLREAVSRHECFRGTLITLGRFTRECKDAALIAEGVQVKLIDGQHLLMLLSENSIGVTRQTVSLYHIDDEYFSSSKDTSTASEN